MALRTSNVQTPTALQFLLLWSVVFLVTSTNGYMIDGNPNRRAAYLDSDARYRLEWAVDWNTNRITFNVTVKTSGWILFGLANNEEDHTGRDVMVGGVLGRKGKPYFNDRHEEGHSDGFAILDKSQDYRLEHASETRTETFLSFSRNFDTCDSEDYAITENKIAIIWAYGDTDNYDETRGGSYRRSGSYYLYLLEPEYSPRIVRDPHGDPRIIGELPTEDSHHLQIWTISTKLKLPTEHTAYMCSIHKAPSLHRKHHIIGYEVHLPDSQSLEHVHHFTVYKCNAPPYGGETARSLFEPFVGESPESCYFVQRPPRNPEGMPTHLCSELTTVWAIGGRAYFFPPQAGIPLGNSIDEYYLVQVHYDNPQHKIGADVSVRMDVWYTPQLRPNDAGFFALGTQILSLPPTILIPPQTSGHRILGHCSKECTERMFPPEGLSVFSASVHSHNSGSQVRIRHFDTEKKVELPWITYDDNYSNRFQQMRHLKEVARILPGDQLAVECTYDNRWTNGSVIGGLSTRQEMCSGFFFYYSRIIDFTQCRSEIVSEEGREIWLGGTENITWAESKIDWVAISPRKLAGKTVTEIADGQRWDEREKAELQRYHLITHQVGSCSRDLFTRSKQSFMEALEVRRQAPNVYPEIEVDSEDDYSGLVEYPFDARPYVPPPPERKCTSRGG